MGASAATAGTGAASTIQGRAAEGAAATIGDFALALGQIASRPYGDNAVLGEIFAGLFKEPLQAAHQAACNLAGTSVDPAVWIKVLGDIQGQGTGQKGAAVAAGNLAGILKEFMQGAVSATPKVQLPILNAGRPAPGFPSPQKPDFRSVQSVVRAIQAFGAIGAREMMTLPARLLIGQTVEAAALLTPGVRSQAGLGQNVHKRLQDGYLLGTAGLETVVDRRVYGPGYGVTPGAGMTLSEAAARSVRPVFTAMQMAWVTRNFDSYVRADVTSITLRQNWEIKPVASTVQGILQEAWYRCSFNWVARTLKQENPAFETDLQELEPGGSWPPSAMTRIVLPAPSGGQGQLVIPFTMPTLPGMVLYAGVSGPTVADAALLILYLLKQVEKQIKKRGKPILDGLAHARDVIAEAAGWVFAFVIVVLVIVAAVIAAIVVLKALAAAAAALLGTAAATLAEALLALGGATVAAGLILMIVDQASNEGDPITALDLGPISIALPASRIPRFLSVYETVLGASYAALCRQLARAQEPKAPPAAV